MEAHQDADIKIMHEIMKSNIKGKRTKRRRPSSALTLTISSTTSSSSTTTTSTTTGAPPNPSGFFPMPTTSSIDFTNILQDNQDEDMANCLILLAHGHNLAPPPPSNAVVPPPLYVYECKTCNRSFNSFQALGGHRASHNKPNKDVHCQPPSKNRTFLSLSPNKNILCSPSGSITKGSKVHECSICGSDFTSGQALGGHMRRHRSMSLTATATVTATATGTCSTSDGCHESTKHKTLLPLDLNLPAPVEDDHMESEFRFGSNNQIIVFSATSLVDCHF